MTSDPTLLVLASLADGDKHGYAMIGDIQDFAGVRLGAGTLYGAITRLEENGWIRSVESEDRRRPYRLTAGSLSIESLGRSRWRLRRTRDVSYVFSIVGRRRTEAQVVSPSSAAGRSPGGSRVGSAGRSGPRVGRISTGGHTSGDLRIGARRGRRAGRARRPMRCHRADCWSAPRERADVRSAVRPRASARRNGGTATCAWVAR